MNRSFLTYGAFGALLGWVCCAPLATAAMPTPPHETVSWLTADEPDQPSATPQESGKPSENPPAGEATDPQGKDPQEKSAESASESAAANEKPHGDAGHDDTDHDDAKSHDSDNHDATGHDDTGHATGGHGHEHNEFDLTHADATDSLEKPEEFKSDLAIYTFIVFLIVMALLWKFAWGPIIEGLDKRESAIASLIEQTKKDSEQAAIQLKQYEAKLADAAEEARSIVAQARSDAEAAAERIRTEAQEAAHREKTRAVQEIQAAKDSALQEVATKGADLAFQLAGRLIKSELKPEDHANLVKEALDQFPSKN